MEIVAFYAQAVSILLEIISCEPGANADLGEICPVVHFTLWRMRNAYCLVLPRTKDFGITF